MPEKYFMSDTSMSAIPSIPHPSPELSLRDALQNPSERILWDGLCAVAEYAFDEPASLPRWTLPEETEVVVTEQRVVYRDPVTLETGELRWPWPQHLRVQPGNRDTGRSATVTQIQLVCGGPGNTFPALVFAGGDLTTVSDADRLANVLRQAIARYRVEHASELGIPAPQMRMLSRLVIGPEFSNYQGGEGQTVSLLGAVAVADSRPEPSRGDSRPGYAAVPYGSPPVVSGAPVASGSPVGSGTRAVSGAPVGSSQATGSGPLLRSATPGGGADYSATPVPNGYPAPGAGNLTAAAPVSGSHADATQLLSGYADQTQSLGGYADLTPVSYDSADATQRLGAYPDAAPVSGGYAPPAPVAAGYPTPDATGYPAPVAGGYPAPAGTAVSYAATSPGSYADAGASGSSPTSSTADTAPASGRYSPSAPTFGGHAAGTPGQDGYPAAGRAFGGHPDEGPYPSAAPVPGGYTDAVPIAGVRPAALPVADGYPAAGGPAALPVADGYPAAGGPAAGPVAGGYSPAPAQGGPRREEWTVQRADEVALNGRPDLDSRAADLAARVASLVSGGFDRDGRPVDQFESQANLSAYLDVPSSAERTVADRDTEPIDRAESVRRTAARFAGNAARGRSAATPRYDGATGGTHRQG